MVTDATGQVTETIHVENRPSKGKTGGRTIPLHPDVQAARATLQAARGDAPRLEQSVLFSERGGGYCQLHTKNLYMSAVKVCVNLLTVQTWFCVVVRGFICLFGHSFISYS